jgi:hypothetical protein
MKSIHAFILAALLMPWVATAAPNAQLKLPEFESLAEKSSESVNITLDSALLGMAAGFLDANNPEDAEAKKLISALKGIYVRSYTFDEDFAYPKADIDMVRKQLSAPGWQRLVEVHSRKEGSNVDIYISLEQNQPNGLAIIASEPREFTIVNIVGAIDLQKLHQLEGKFGVPKMQLEEEKSPADQKKGAPPSPQR